MNDSILTDVTVGYEPPRQSYASFLYDANRPLFTTMAIEPMLCDPRVILGMANLSGPIMSNAKFYVDCKDVRVKEFVAQQIQRLWRIVEVPLASMEYGWQPAEILYRTKDGVVQLDTLRYIHPNDARPYMLRGQFVGMGVHNSEFNFQSQFVPSNPRWPKCLWTVHRRKRSRWFGESRLKGAFMPWYEKWAVRGYRDQRQLWFFKCAFAGPKVYYPAGSQVTTISDGQGNVQTVDNKAKAQQIGDAYASGCTIAIERKAGTAQGMLPDWEVLDPTAREAPQGLLSYGISLDDEILEGLEVAPEVIRGSGPGGGEGGINIGGAGGRDIPQQAFYSILQGILQPTITDFDEQCISPLVSIVFGPNINYEIECFGLLRSEQQSQPTEAQNALASEQGTTDSNGTAEEEIAASDTDHRGCIFLPLDSHVRGWRSRARRESAFNFSVVRSA